VALVDGRRPGAAALTMACMACEACHWRQSPFLWQAMGFFRIRPVTPY
jgi:hypothetical protein